MNTEPCEGACGSQVFAELHTPESCRRLAQAARDKAAEKVEAKRVV